MRKWIVGGLLLIALAAFVGLVLKAVAVAIGLVFVAGVVLALLVWGAKKDG